MRILEARRAVPVAREVKSDSSVRDHELHANGNGNRNRSRGSQDQDIADMQKLGMLQQTKVSASTYLPRALPRSLTMWKEKIRVGDHPRIHHHHDVYLGIGTAVSTLTP